MKHGEESSNSWHRGMGRGLEKKTWFRKLGVTKLILSRTGGGRMMTEKGLTY
jgi:hypothetical protein